MTIFALAFREYIPEFIFNLFSDVKLQLNAKFSEPSAEESRSLMNTSTIHSTVGVNQS